MLRGAILSLTAAGAIIAGFMLVESRRVPGDSHPRQSERVPGESPPRLESETCPEGYVSGPDLPSLFWRSWCVRANSGGPCGLRWCDGPGDPPAYGIVSHNTTGRLELAPELRRKGWVELDVFFDTATEPNNWGGKHLFSISSIAQERQLHSKLPGWCRPDITPVGGRLRIDLYNTDGNGDRWFRRPNGELDWVVGQWTTRQPLNATQRWVHVKLAWERLAPDRLLLVVNDFERQEFRIHPDSGDLGRFLYLGNMDRSELPDGSTPQPNNMDGNGQIRFSGIRTGRTGAP